MEQIHINDVHELISKLNDLKNHFVYRGQSNAVWPLCPSLERLIKSANDPSLAKKFEDHYTRVFRSKFHLYDTENQIPTSKLGWLAMMQHYGVPTRLLDFTDSPYVALYFALEGLSPNQKEDMALFAIDYSAFTLKTLSILKAKGVSVPRDAIDLELTKDSFFEECVDGVNPALIWITEPQQLNKRIDRQKGSFVLSSDPAVTLEEVLSSHHYSSCSTIKFTIDRKLYTAIFALLRKINLDSRVLYGDLHGLGKSIQMEMAAYSRVDQCGAVKV